MKNNHTREKTPLLLLHDRNIKTNLLQRRPQKFMKKTLAIIFTVVILTFSTILPVWAIDYGENWGFELEPVAEFAHIVDAELLCESGVEDFLADFFGIKKSDIVKEEMSLEDGCAFWEHSVEWAKDCDKLYYKYYICFDGKADGDNYDVVVYLSTGKYDPETYEGSNVMPHNVQSLMKIEFSGEAINKFDSAFFAYLNKMNTPQELFDLCEQTPDDKYNSLPQKYEGSTLFHEYWNSELRENGVELADTRTTDVPNRDQAYFISKTDVLIKRWVSPQYAGAKYNKNGWWITGSIYNEPLFYGVANYDLLLTYAPTEESGDDTLNYEIDTAVIYLSYYDFSVATAPQTSLTTAVYAAVAALALGVVVVKKKRG